MKKSFWIYLSGIAAIFFIFSHLLPTETAYEKPITEQTVTTEPEAIILPSLRERVGQLIAVGHWRETPLEETTAYVRDHSVGSVIIMQAPTDEAEIATWTDTWQRAAGTPLVISIDQEGGTVSRLRGEEHIQIAQPVITDTLTASAIAEERATALATLGINANYAPVVDRSTNPSSFMYDRVFREPDDIASLADVMVRGYQANEVLAVPKHFPGHPDTADDSHLTLPVLELTSEEYEIHTAQFAELFASGNTHMLMTAHVLVTPLDAENPATLSPAVMNDLRTRLQYDGVVITDDLAMQAISDRYTHEEAAVLALQAGVDMIMLAAEPEHTESTIAAVVAAVESGRLSEARVNEAYERVLEVKENFLDTEL